MKSSSGSVVLALCLLFVVVCCSPPPKEVFKDSGLFDEHALVRMESFGATQGSVSGGFFLGIGSVNGSLGSEFKIQFYWSPKPGEIVASALPYSKFRFIIDETKNTPTVEFVFNDLWLNNETGRNYSESRFPNLNDFVLSDIMQLARVRISSATMEREVYLPKIK
jgi:hypothetical protein